MSSSQRPFFFSTFFSAIRQQPAHQQPNKTASSTTPTTSTSPNNASSGTATSTSAATAPPSSASTPRTIPPQQPQQSRSPSTVLSPRSGMPIPGARRRGSDSSSEGFREVLGADKWYIGGRTATGEERYFKLGVVKRVRSNDGFSIDKLSL
ncbi:uncharacterized protein DNG_02767 [Cephalotrichum gorgonifer]|uniref:Uncharacterized protein n=1 Tax=Cephalotrichum gorgonifer TaxID=2041049 RepID=A0AAE8MTL1_9PEZI|nr:uncharacterized protein DNG_02767 [Cephalotrichum gorgonifer]